MRVQLRLTYEMNRQLQADSNLVIYAASGATWASGIKGNTAPYTLLMQDDGNLVIYDSKNRAIWASGTNR